VKLVDEFREAGAVQQLAAALRRATTRPWTLMEVCGGQTHALLRFGIDRLLPPELELIHGPGCPVCVTAVSTLDLAAALARTPGVTLCTFGDMLRVPGSHGDLLSARAAGADVRVVYSPLDALQLAQREPERQVVFLAVGFETTAPTTALAAAQARQAGTRNFSLLVAHVLVPPAMAAILAAPDCRVQSFLAAGHVCTIMGTAAYAEMAARYQVPIAVTGFEPVDLLRGVLACVEQLERGEHRLDNRYARAVRPVGNEPARALLEEVFVIGPQRWRGLGELPASGYHLRDRYRELDATLRFPLTANATPGAAERRCQSGLVLQGRIRPPECPEFGKGCTPEHPLGATMVSSEGACAAYYHYRAPGPPAERAATSPKDTP